MKLGSLFDGSGGFPLAGSLCGITPAWASEVEPYPIAVTRSRFPDMKHLGDVSKVHGGQVEPVDIITFGSPCQDLSTAGKQAGIKHAEAGDDTTTRSGLFMEAVRIIREMREASDGLYPRFALWENVPGAFISNHGADFRIVLEELIQIVEPKASMPAIPENGWAYADHYVGPGWSLAYRTFDAQYWGVAQRRRRIHLVLDLGGKCAGRVLFQRDGLRRVSDPAGAHGQAAASRGHPVIAGGRCTAEKPVAYAMDPGFYTVGRELSPTMLANMQNFPHIIFQPPKPPRKITPTECARLQGFPDRWGDIGHKDDFTDEELAFWREVRRTYAEINGSRALNYSKEAMVKWYNGLHTNGAEWKMWGNGIALPPALYCMQGMAEVLQKQEERE